MVRPLNGSATFAKLLKNAQQTASFLRSMAVVRFQNWHVSVTGTVYVCLAFNMGMCLCANTLEVYDVDFACTYCTYLISIVVLSLL